MLRAHKDYSMVHVFLVFNFITSVVNLQAKPFDIGLKNHSAENGLNYPNIELNKEYYSHLVDGIIAQLREANGYTIDVAPAGLVFDFKVFLPFLPSKEHTQGNGTEKRLAEQKGGEEVAEKEVKDAEQEDENDYLYDEGEKEEEEGVEEDKEKETAKEKEKEKEKEGLLYPITTKYQQEDEENGEQGIPTLSPIETTYIP